MRLEQHGDNRPKLVLVFAGHTTEQATEILRTRPDMHILPSLADPRRQPRRACGDRAGRWTWDASRVTCPACIDLVSAVDSPGLDIV